VTFSWLELAVVAPVAFAGGASAGWRWQHHRNPEENRMTETAPVHERDEPVEPGQTPEPEPEPNPEPDVEPSDPHTGPLEDHDDARYLDPADPRRLEVERRRGRPFNADDEEA
jgi:hypothetical protein